MKILIEIILDMFLVIFVVGIILLLTEFCFLVYGIKIDPILINLTAIMTVISWLILVVFCILHFLGRAWENKIEKELWKTIFSRGFFTSGLTMGVIAYYLSVLRRSIRYYPFVYHKIQVRKQNISKSLMEFLYYTDSISSNITIMLLFCIFLGFFLKLDFIVLNGAKAFALIFLFRFLVGFPFGLELLNHIANKKWSDDSFKEVLKWKIKKYYREVYRENENR